MTECRDATLAPVSLEPEVVANISPIFTLAPPAMPWRPGDRPVKALGKPRVDLRRQVVRLLLFPLLVPEPT
jgi:hypothetical protein